MLSNLNRVQLPRLRPKGSVMREITLVQIQFSVEGEGSIQGGKLIVLAGRELHLANLAEDAVLWTRHRCLVPEVSGWTSWTRSVGNIVRGDQSSFPPWVETLTGDDTGGIPVIMHVQVNTEQGSEDGSQDMVLADPGPDALELTGLPQHGSYWLRHRMVLPWATRWTGWELAGGESVDGRRFNRALRDSDTGEWVLPRVRSPAANDVHRSGEARPPPPAALWVGRDSDNSPDVELWWILGEDDLHLINGYRVYRAEGLRRMVDDSGEVLNGVDIRLVHEDRDIPNPQYPSWTDTTATPALPYTYAVVSLSRGRAVSDDRISTALVADAPRVAG